MKTKKPSKTYQVVKGFVYIDPEKKELGAHPGSNGTEPLFVTKKRSKRRGGFVAVPAFIIFDDSHVST